MQFIGLDAGSVSVKLVLLDEEGKLLERHYERHKGHPLMVAFRLLKKVIDDDPSGGARKGLSHCYSLSLTGSSGRLIASALGTRFTNELVAQEFSTKRLYPHVRTIFELGGEDSKLIILGETGIKDFSMNSVCAAGTGSFLDQQAERLRLSIEEFSELAMKPEKPSRIAGRCSVFAKSDMIHLQQIATPVENIVAGLCFAVARNFRGSIVRGRTIEEPVSFHGGVAANQGMVRAFREVFSFRQFLVPSDYALMGAIGAALKDKEEGVVHAFKLEDLRVFISSLRFSEQGHLPLISAGDDFPERHLICNPHSTAVHPAHRFAVSFQKECPSAGDCRASTLKIEAYLGIDIGSISTNLAVIDNNGSLLAKRYLMTAGRPIEAVRQGLQEIAEEVGNGIQVMGVGTTGSGRYMIADYVGADIVKNEITAQATAAAFIDATVDTIFEIGGQDSKYISLRDGVIVDFEMNKACAAGTGSFLEEQSEKLNVSIKEEFAASAFSAENPCRLGERCTVFMENSLMANLQKGAGKNALLAGLAYSIVQNYINKVVAGKPIGKTIFFQGGVAFNKSVVAAFEKYLGRKIIVPPHHDVTGAIGMALIAKRHRENQSSDHGLGCSAAGHNDTSLPAGSFRPSSTFKGFQLSRRPYEVTSFECKGCPNVCEINRVKIEGEDGYLFYGGRCEKYDVKKKEDSSARPDLFAFREEILWKEHLKRRSSVSSRQSPVIGIPSLFFFHDYLPFWTTLLWELGFEVMVSPKTNREIIRDGIENVLADTCFPVKVAHGHVRHLIKSGVTTLFMPSFIDMNAADDGEFERGYACPLTQTIPYAAQVAHQKVRLITPVICLSRGKQYLVQELLRVLKPYGIRKKDMFPALMVAERAQQEFFTAVKEKGSEILSSLKEKTVVIVGRPYNAFDSGMNLTIPRKLSDLGVASLPMDFLPIEGFRIADRWPNMYWRSGQRILKAARYIKENPHLYPIFIGNFSCGPDSFILKYFEKEMEEKPFLHIEIDEHSADAGAVTRCEAFLDSIGKQKRPFLTGLQKNVGSQGASPPDSHPGHGRKIGPFTRSSSPGIAAHRLKRTVFIPRMSDHAFALAAAFERCGLSAEVLPESDKESVDIGRRYVSGKECYPCTVTTGDMLKKVFSPDFRPEESVFFMPSGSGPCRFGQYNVFHRMILDELGCRDVPIFSPNQDVSFYQELGVVSKDYSLFAWRGIVAIELLCKCLHETRPYEKETGAADHLFEKYLRKLCLSLRGADGKIETTLNNMRRDFEGLPKLKEKRPVIGVVGEIFVRSHRFSNENLIRKIEAHGGEAWLAPVEEWIYYVNLMATRKALIKKDSSAIIVLLLKTFFQKRTAHHYAKYYQGFLRTLKEPGTKEILNRASPYIDASFEGEAVLSIGKSIDLIGRGVSGIINAMPFGCMPGTVVTTIMRGVSRDYGIPCITMPFDGSESSTTEIQLEAFMNQAKQYKVLPARSR